MRKAALHNLGCKVNSYETQSMEQMLKEAGYEIVDFEGEKADVYIINTCSVTNMADRKSRQMLHRAKKLNPNAVVVAAGCYVQAASEELIKDLAVDIVIGNNKKKDLVEILEGFIAKKETMAECNPELAVIDIAKSNEYEALEIDEVSDHTRAFIKVQDGCNQFCTYCIIPYVRGRIRSRKVEDVLAEVTKLVRNGYKEIVLTGIHLSSYGLDWPEEERTLLIELIEKVCAVDGIQRVRLGSLEPRIVTDEFAKRLALLDKICPHFHLSLQSGCDTTLKRMNRRYNTEEFEEGCNILRKHFEHPAITTDVIVGFPQETDEEFETTVEFLKRIRFFEMHVFKYSRRKGTVADKMAGQIADSVKNVRSDCLIDLDEQLSKEYREWYVGKQCDVLMEESIEVNGERYFVGHTPTYVKVAIKTDQELENEILRVTIQGNLDKDIMLGVE